MHSVAAGASACSGCTPGTYSTSSGAYSVFKVGQHYVFLLLKGRRGKAEAMVAVVRHQQVANEIKFFLNVHQEFLKLDSCIRMEMVRYLEQ